VFARYEEVTLREGPVHRTTQRSGGFGSTGQG
jgi:dUTPase